MDQIMAMVTEIAEDKDAGADRFRALKFLSLQQETSSPIPAPMSEQEILNRLYRLMLPSGKYLCQRAYNKAFPKASEDIATGADEVKIIADDLDIDYSSLPRTLRQLNRRFPEIKRPGTPPGYPVGQGLLIQQSWVRKQAVKLLVDRAREGQRLAKKASPEDPVEDGA